MYRVFYYIYNTVHSKDFETLDEAFNFWHKLPFETFRELRKV